LIEIRKRRYITFAKLSKYLGIRASKLEIAHLMALWHLNYVFPSVYTDPRGRKSVKYEVMKSYIAEKEPEFMKNAQTWILEPNTTIDISKLPPTNDEKAISYMRNKF
jgi:hypothetical protein